MTYVDGFVVPVPHDKKEAYRAMAAKALPLFKEHGVLQLVECWGDDIKHGETTDFYRAVRAEEGENVVFSWMTWESKEARDAGWEKMMADERMQPDGEMPFDGKRMFFGGFSILLDSDA
ncbi:DUF1428 domain-containing protein [Stakelama saccharophila]|uniref:DUF1428 domain-containing protein n=1 Tax=Stakelama saccharophila TaxID=3075605 RepID=A0ABZ0BAQ6_9SPHN|nr:DUF1428 domain-containing protein [Stakelama sp. W311]WNO54464.1 DUF1428 domain-containing protein [Stakelama sp. W311]